MRSSPSAGFVYIMGRGHSGSTLLDVLLGHAGDTLNLGEVGSCLGRGDQLCSCGSRIGECAFWRRVARSADGGEPGFAGAADTIRRAAPAGRFARMLVAGRDDRRVATLLEAHRVLLDALVRTTGRSHFVDASKGLTRALLLARFDPASRIVHLVRHPYGVLASHFRRIRAGESIWMLGRRRAHRGAPWLLLGSILWLTGNLLAEIVAAFAGERCIRVRYEDLCRDPGGELRRIGRACGIDVEPVIARLERGETFTVGHSIGGNDVRFEGRIVLDPGRDRARELPVWARAITFAVCWPLMSRYGYTASGHDRAPRLRAAEIRA